MTGRRAMGGWDQRLSRALQFQPGHVGGRVASTGAGLSGGMELATALDPTSPAA